VNVAASRDKPDYLAGYPDALVAKVHQLIEQDRVGELLLKKYPQAHDIRTDKALYQYVEQIRAEHLRNAGQLHRVAYDSKLRDLKRALGLHTRRSQVHGGNLRAKREIAVAALFREAPLPFLRMIVVHELAHLKELEHDKAFYQLCRHMEPDYAQLEFDVRVYLCYLEVGGARLWGG
jgi:predicted metal-dependent hydrolase